MFPWEHPSCSQGLDSALSAWESTCLYMNTFSRDVYSYALFSVRLSVTHDKLVQCP